MNVSITPQLENFLQERVQVGRFNNVSEAVRAAVRLLQLQEQHYEERATLLRAEIDKGFEGDSMPFTRELVEDIKVRSRERYQAKRTLPEDTHNSRDLEALFQ